MQHNYFPLCMVLMLIYCSAVAQPEMKGQVKDAVSGLGLPFVNISVKGTTNGTISNKDGFFSIECNHGDTLVFSHIGYEKQQKAVRTGFLPVLMKQAAVSLNEVIVMPDNTLRKLLKNAYDKIPENYAVTNTRSLGFYRESAKNENGDFMYFAEAYLEMVRGSVKLPNDNGQVKILKSRGNTFASLDTTTNFRFYGGLFWGNSDFVKEKLDFISPSHFSEYNYSVLKIDTLYKISFSPRNNKGKYAGYFILDPGRLAYLEGKYKRLRDFKPELFYKRLSAQYYDKFIKQGDRYYLKYCYYEGAGLDQLKKNKIIHEDEFLATEIEPGTRRIIPQEEQVHYFDIFTDIVPDYSNTFWKGYNTVEADSQLLKNLDLHFRKNDALTLLENRFSVSKTKKKNLDFVRRIRISYSCTYSSVHLKKGDYKLYFPQPDFTVQNSLKHDNFDLFGISSCVEYKLSNTFSASFTGTGMFGKNVTGEELLLGVNSRQRLNRFGRAYYLSLFSETGLITPRYKMGTMKTGGSVKWGNKTFTGDEIEIYLANRQFVFKPGIALTRQAGGLKSLFLKLSCNVALSEKEGVIFLDKSGLFNKEAFQKTDTGNVHLFVNGNQVDKTGMRISDFSVSLGIIFN